MQNTEGFIPSVKLCVNFLVNATKPLSYNMLIISLQIFIEIRKKRWYNIKRKLEKKKVERK